MKYGDRYHYGFEALHPLGSHAQPLARVQNRQAGDRSFTDLRRENVQVIANLSDTKREEPVAHAEVRVPNLDGRPRLLVDRIKGPIQRVPQPAVW